MNSYKQIAKATGLIGFVQVIQIFLGMIRNKIIAIAVGSYGFGIWSLYNSYIDMVSQFSVLGLDKSGVRQIAKNPEDKDSIPKIIYIFKNTILLISIITTTISIVFAKRISKSLFDTEDNYWGVIIVSFVILFNGISNGQKSILNGLRDLRGLAKSQIIGSIVGTITAILSVYYWGIKGIPIYVFVVGLTAVISTWWYTKKLNIKKIKPTSHEFSTELKILFKVGIGFSIAGIISAIMTYSSRIYLTNHFSIEMVGIYQASWTISNLYIGMILGAMGVDLMPRLMKVVNEDNSFIKLINEQMEIGILLSSIGVMAILIFSPLILQLLYSHEFSQGVSIIRWQILGVSLRILGFPFSHAIMAKEKSVTYIIVQAIFWISDFILLMIFSQLFGFNGLGINYFIAYSLYFLLTWFVCIKLFKYKPTSLLLKMLIKSYLFIACAYVCFYLIFPFNYVIGSLLILINLYWIIKTLKKKMQINILNIVKNKKWN